MTKETEKQAEQVLVDQILIKQYEDQFVIQRLDSEGKVVSEDPVADVTMLDTIKKAVTLVEERVTYLRTRNASFEGYLLALDQLRKQQEQALAAQAETEEAPAKVEMPA